MSKKIGPLKSYSCILHTGKTALESRTGIYTEIHLGIIEYYCRRLDVTFSMHMSTAVVGSYWYYYYYYYCVLEVPTLYLTGI